jgi:hypothetical protein
MSTFKTVTILTDELLDRAGDFTERLYAISVVDTPLVGTPEEHASTKRVLMTVKVSRSLQSTWRLSDEELRAVMYESGKRFLVKSIGSGDSSPSINLDLNTSTAPAKCPYGPSRITIDLGKPFEVESTRPLGFQRGK